MAICFAALAIPSVAQMQAGTAQAKKVGVVTLERQSVPRIFDLPGRAVAYEQVEVRPRVGGVVTKIVYIPGEVVDVGDPLFELDDANYVADVASKSADLIKAEADLPVKQAAYDRALKLEGQGYTKAQVESAQFDLASARATLDAAKAALEYAKTQLSWTRISSPIQGFPEVWNVSVGDLVTSGQDNALTTVTRLDPIYVDMLETSARILEVRNMIDSGNLSVNKKKLRANLILENGETYTGNGSLVAPSATVSTSTGTVSMRFEFENTQRKIMPGMFLRGTIEIGRIKAFLVPQRAGERSATGDLTVYIVGEGSKAKRVTLEALGSYDNSWIVSDGLEEGQQLILDGLKNMASGTLVEPVPAEIDEDGLVKNSAADDTAHAAESRTPKP